MTRQELMNTYAAMSISKERADALENELMKLFSESAEAESEYIGEAPKEYRIESKKRIPTAAIIASAAAVLCVVSVGVLLNKLPTTPVTSYSVSTSEPTEEALQTDEPPVAETREQTAEPTDEALDNARPLPILYSDFEMNFELIDPFCYYWFPVEGDSVAELVCIGANEDIFGSTHGYESDIIADMYCGGFCEDDMGWYMQGSNRNGGDSIYYVAKSNPERMFRYDYGSDAAPSRNKPNREYIRQGKADWSFTSPNNDGSFYASAMQYSDREPVENYVGQISWLGKEKLCIDHGESWANEFNKWYNCGGSITYQGAEYLRTPLLAAGSSRTEDRFGMGRVWLIDHTDTKIVAAFRFTSADWIAYRQTPEASGVNGEYFLTDYPNAYAARYFVLTANMIDGEWQERWEPLEHIDAMGMQGELLAEKYSEGFIDEGFAWGHRAFTAIISGDSSELFSYNRQTDEYIRQNRYTYSKYLQSDDRLYVVGKNASDEIGMYLSNYSIESGGLQGQSDALPEGTVEQYFVEPGKKFLVLIIADDSGAQHLYLFEPETLELINTAVNTAESTQFELDEYGVSIEMNDGHHYYPYNSGDVPIN